MKTYKIATIAGDGIANPIGQIWSGVLTPDHLREKEAARTISNSIEKTLSIKKNELKIFKVKVIQHSVQKLF